MLSLLLILLFWELGDYFGIDALKLLAFVFALSTLAIVIVRLFVRMKGRSGQVTSNDDQRPRKSI